MDILTLALEAALAGLPLTLLTWLGGAVLGLVLGLLVACGRHLGPRPLRWALTVAVELVRGTPFLIQSFLLYYGGPFVGLTLTPVTAGLLSLSVYGAAYYSEVLRGGFVAIPPSRLEAARLLGLSHAQSVLRILLPGAALAALPALVNLTIILLKETAVLSIITVPEITFQVTSVGSSTFRYAPAMAVLALFYWALVELMSFAGRRAERTTERLLAA